MPSEPKKIQDFALRSVLFKGRADLYFCYLKSQRVAQVVMVLSNSGTQDMSMLIEKAGKVPESILYLAAGELQLPLLIAEIYSLISALQINAALGIVHKENTDMLISECETITERLISGTRLSPFISTEDLTVSLVQDDMLLPERQERDTHKGHIKGQTNGLETVLNRSTGRSTKILEYVRANNGVSIKDISGIVRNCSEKTIQRELLSLIRQGMIKKVGERRWSIYMPVK